MPTNQETFDIVTKHLLEQGCRSENEDTCLYQGPNGTKCAAGILIPDGQYDEEFENTPVMYDDVSYGPVGVLLEKLGYDVYLVQALQYVHDQNLPKSWPQALREVANTFNLECSL